LEVEKQISPLRCAPVEMTSFIYGPLIFFGGSYGLLDIGPLFGHRQFDKGSSLGEGFALPPFAEARRMGHPFFDGGLKRTGNYKSKEKYGVLRFAKKDKHFFPDQKLLFDDRSYSTGSLAL
jgi:hypothetical protein